ncbi:BadF/BadG/BcrA/BcrD ATPase family protein [Bacillus sp. Cr_A10]|uniref:N-acetylglucosamine kinase n=1 Tax=Bacillus sp. Cr_A10 TaxID=3033993 RepID=UPI0023DA0E2C|nr:BadF/BadG/BcrA/BcrD ATPase family protein [Bacillus sp. Cr_A10]MDF2067829.1 BadF/BadG/BcrA/BcrD ATPase family protein [Bacillus sp. Cr_A10]
MHLSEEYFIGVDGGGTKTVCVIGDNSGRIISKIVGKGSNIKSTKPENVRIQILELLNTLLKQSGIQKEQVSAIYIGTAGGDREEDKRTWIDWMSIYFQSHPCRIQITNDAVPALVSGSFSLNGLVVIAGTGSIAYLVQDDGARTTRSGGWGYLFGDEGSGYHIGNEALRYVTRYIDKHGNFSQDELLTQAVLRHFKLQNSSEIITAVYDNDNPRTAIASLAKPVIELAEQKYGPANDIVQHAITSLVKLLSTILEREQETKGLPIVLSGGLFLNDMFCGSFVEAMRKFDNELYVPSLPPVIGSYINALLSVGIPLTPKLKREVIESWKQL